MHPRLETAAKNTGTRRRDEAQRAMSPSFASQRREASVVPDEPERRPKGSASDLGPEV
jgi:hypothetical protein